jgi:hypothetical protein
MFTYIKNELYIKHKANEGVKKQTINLFFTLKSNNYGRIKCTTPPQQTMVDLAFTGSRSNRDPVFSAPRQQW